MAICATEMMRLMAPEPPFEDRDLRVSSLLCFRVPIFAVYAYCCKLASCIIVGVLFAGCV